MFVGQIINHKKFGRGEIINIIDKRSGVASKENYVIVSFDKPMLTEMDKLKNSEVMPITERTFTPESLAANLVEEEK